MTRINRVPRTFLAASLAVALVVLTRTAAVAQELGEGQVGGAVTSFGFGDWLGLGVRLALVIAAIWAGVTGMRWYVRRVNGGPGRSRIGALEVLETHALGPNRTLHLVRLGDRAVLIGATPERITQLMTVDDPGELQRLTEPPADEANTRAVGRRTGTLASLRTGLLAMNDRRRALNERNERARAQRTTATELNAQSTEAAAPDAPRESAGRFAGLRSMFTRPAAGQRTRTARDTRTAAPAAESREERRQSLFDRTLASIDAVEISTSNAAAGLRARNGYGQVSTTTAPMSQPRRSMDSGLPREAQIADLQRAIAAARRNAG